MRAGRDCNRTPLASNASVAGFERIGKILYAHLDHLSVEGHLHRLVAQHLLEVRLLNESTQSTAGAETTAGLSSAAVSGGARSDDKLLEATCPAEGEENPFSFWFVN